MAGPDPAGRQDCLIVADGGTWVPDVCEFFLEVDRTYDLSMPRLTRIRVDYYYNSESLPPGLTLDGNRVRGSPALEGTWTPRWVAVIEGASEQPSITCTFNVEQGTQPGWSGICDWTFTVGHSYTRALPVADGATTHLWTGDEPDGMRMRFVRIHGGWGQQLSGTPTSEGTWTGTLTPFNTSEGVDPIDCSFEVLPGPDVVECSRTIPSDQINAARDAVEWRTDVPRPAVHPDIPGGNYLITTGDPGVGGGSPRVWPWWASDDDLTVTDTTGCVWQMTEIISSAHPLFVWYDNEHGRDPRRRVGAAHAVAGHVAGAAGRGRSGRQAAAEPGRVERSGGRDVAGRFVRGGGHAGDRLRVGHPVPRRMAMVSHDPLPEPRRLPAAGLDDRYG